MRHRVIKLLDYDLLTLPLRRKLSQLSKKGLARGNHSAKNDRCAKRGASFSTVGSAVLNKIVDLPSKGQNNDLIFEADSIRQEINEITKNSNNSFTVLNSFFVFKLF